MNAEEADNRVWEVWMQDLDTKAEGTKKLYLRYFKRFCERWGYKADELYEMRKTDWVSPEPIDRRRMERMLKTSVSEFLKQGRAPSTCRNMIHAVNSFFESMNMELHFKKKDYPKGDYKGSLVITAPQIVKMYEDMIYGFLRLRNRALLLSLKDSGLRISDLGAMDYGYWLQAETIYNEHGETFKVFDPEHTQKMKVLAYIHLGPESIAAIEEYLKDRQDRGEILTEESPLFLDMDGIKVSRAVMSSLFRRYARKLKLKRISAHSLRKFHRTRLQKSKMNDEWINKLQGKMSDPYSQPEEDGDLTEGYLESYNFLRVFEKPSDMDETERLRKELYLVRAIRAPEVNMILDRLQALENSVNIAEPSQG